MKDLITTLSKRTIGIITLAFFSLSAFFIYIALHNTGKPTDLVGESSIISNIMDDCEIAANELGFKDVIVTKGRVRRIVSIKESSVDDAMDLIYRTSILKSECKKFTMVEYCMGEDCRKSDADPVSQFRMVLKLKTKK